MQPRSARLVDLFDLLATNEALQVLAEELVAAGLGRWPLDAAGPGGAAAEVLVY